MARIIDGDWSLFDYDFHTGRSTWMMRNGDGTMTFRVDTPADAILNANRAEANATSGQRFGDWRKVASVPLNMMEHSGLGEAMRQGDDRFVSRFLNDSDHSGLRTFRGRI